MPYLIERFFNVEKDGSGFSFQVTGNYDRIEDVNELRRCVVALSEVILLRSNLMHRTYFESKKYKYKYMRPLKVICVYLRFYFQTIVTSPPPLVNVIK